MDGVKKSLVTWAVGGAGEGLQGLGNAPYPLPLILGSCTIAADALATLRVAIVVIEFATTAYLRRAVEGMWFRCILLTAASAHTTVASAFVTFPIGSDVQRLHNGA